MGASFKNHPVFVHRGTTVLVILVAYVDIFLTDGILQD